MNSIHESNCLRIQARFEGQEAIYIEGHVVRVKVSNIRFSRSVQTISATVTEIPTEGFFRAPWPSWQIGAGYLTEFSDNFWNMGYGGWSMYFRPTLIHETMKTVAQFPRGIDPGDWNETFHDFFSIEWLAQIPFERVELVFP